MPDKEVADTLPASSVAASMKQAFRLDKLAAPFTSAFALEMEQRGLGSPRALSTIVPNLLIPDYGSAMTSSVYLRGFGSRIDNPVLGLYIDDIPILDKNLYDFDFLDIRRADLLRGPQGTRYGPWDLPSGKVDGLRWNTGLAGPSPPGLPGMGNGSA